MSPRLSRREVAAVLAAPAAAFAQAPASPKPQAAEDLLEAARGQVRRNAELLAKQEMPMTTEPAFQFHP
jgi:hypothetical protein